MGTNDDVILTIAGMIRDETVMNAAVLAGDLVDAHEHALDIRAKARELIGGTGDK